MKLYLAGPMSGIPQFNYPAFDTAAEELREQGYEVVNPAEMDGEEVREAALESTDGIFVGGMVGGDTWGEMLARDVQMVADEVDGVALLPFWGSSRGARLEVFTAILCDIPVYIYMPWETPSLEEFPPLEIMNIIHYGLTYGKS